MQLNITTDYAVRTVLYLAIQDKVISSMEIAEKMAIPRNYLLKITRRLLEAGIISRYKGVYGGFSLHKAPEDITLFEIVETMEGVTKINRCLEEDKYCSRFGTKDCPVRNVYCSLQGDIEKRMSGVTIKSLMENMN